MMKKILSLLLILSMLLSLCACGGSGGSTGTDAQSEDGGSSGVSVDSGLFDVTITIPAEFLDEDMTQADLDAEAQENGYKSITLNEDGSATYVMSKAKHQEMMQEIRKSIDESLASISESYSDIVSAAANNDYTQYTVTVNTEDVGLEASFAVLGLYIFSAMYHAFNGTELGNVNVQYVNEATGEVINEFNSDDMNDSSGVNPDSAP